MSDKEKVVFLAYRNTALASNVTENLACANCRNKTWLLRYEGGAEAPRLVCPVCGFNGGKIGWFDEGGEHDLGGAST